MRVISRPSTALCTLSMYVAFLLSEPRWPSCCRLAEVMAISHDSVNRFLERERYTPADLFAEGKAGLNLRTCLAKKCLLKSSVFCIEGKPWDTRAT